LVTQDAEKCASVAQQLLNGKRQTRWVLCMFEFGSVALNWETCCAWVLMLDSCDTRTCEW
jgi:hypothetical protein